MKKLVFILASALTLVLGSTVAFAGDMSSSGMQTDGGSSSSSGGGWTAPTPVSNNVVIKDFAFTPGSLVVPLGTTVTWINRDNTAHTVTGTVGGGTATATNSPMSGTLQPGQSYSFRFGQTGTFPYHCSIHPTMQAAIVVSGPVRPTPPGTTTPPSNGTNGMNGQSNGNDGDADADDQNMNMNMAPSSSQGATTPTPGTNTNTNTNSATATNNIYYTGSSGTQPQQTTTAAAPVYPTPASTPTYTAPVSTPSSLPNTGASNVIALAGAATVLGSGLGYLYVHRKNARNRL
jgi:LPXTG-motif cell wall-anchored protein